MLYTSPWCRFELTTSVLIDTDYIGSCKSNYHAITPQRPPEYIYSLCSIYLLIYQDISEYNEFVGSSHHCVLQNKNKGPSWSWSHGGWIYKYLCNQSVSIATNVVSSNPVHGEFYSIQYYAMKFIRDLRQSVVFSEYAGSSTYKTDRHNRTELLLKHHYPHNLNKNPLMTQVQIKGTSDKWSNISKQCFHWCSWSHSHCAVLSNYWFTCKSHVHTYTTTIYRLVYWYKIWGRGWWVRSH